MQLPKSTVLIVTEIVASVLMLPVVPLVHSNCSFPRVRDVVVKVQPVQVSEVIGPVGFTVALPALVSSPLIVDPVQASSALLFVSTQRVEPPDGMVNSNLAPTTSLVAPL